MMVTLFTVFSTIQSKVVTTVPAKQTSIVWLKCQTLLSTVCGTGCTIAREYGGLLDNRSFGGAQVSRTFYAKGQTGQQLLLGAYSALSRQVNVGTVKLYTRYEMEDVVSLTDVPAVSLQRTSLPVNWNVLPPTLW